MPASYLSSPKITMAKCHIQRQQSTTCVPVAQQPQKYPSQLAIARILKHVGKLMEHALRELKTSITDTKSNMHM